MATSNNGQKHDRSALILYGTETGNSEECAGDLGRMLERLHFATSVREMDEVEINILPRYTLVIFAVSTTGQGEFPRNSRKFWKSLLRKRLPLNCLSHVNFTTFGLGDSSYSKFNWTARKLHKRLEQLGAKEIYPRGEGDEQHSDGWDGTFLSWKIDLSKHVRETYPLPEGKDIIPDNIPLPPKYLLEILPEDERPSKTSLPVDYLPTSSSTIHLREREASTSSPGPAPGDILAQEALRSLPSHDSSSTPKPTPTPADMKLFDPPEWHADVPIIHQQLKNGHPGIKAPGDKCLPPETLLNIHGSYTAELTKNKRSTPKGHWQDVRELSFLVPESVQYFPGDVVTIYPKNFPVDVQALVEIQGWEDIADTPLKLQRTAASLTRGEEEVISYLPAWLNMSDGSTLRDLLTDHLDITSIPKRNFLQNMSYFTEDEMHKERLQEFCNPMYTDEFFDYTTRPRRSILEVLEDFPTVKLPWNQAAWLFPFIRGRQFSITSGGYLANSQHEGYKKVDLLVAIVKYRTVLKKIRQGLCSRYLAALPEGSSLQITFDRPSDKFYDLTYREPHRPVLMIAAGTGIAPCRSLIWERSTLSNADRSVPFGSHHLIYGGRNKKADFFFSADWQKKNLTVDVATAFSRDQQHKIYVQDVIRQQSEEIYDLIMKGAVIYVCGSAGSMPKAVKQAFMDVLVEFVGVGDGSERDMEDIKIRAEKLLEDMTKGGRYIEETW